MASVLLFTFEYSFDTYINVYVDDIDPTIITSSRPIFYVPGEDPYPVYIVGADVGSPTCQGTTLTRYTYNDARPFAEYVQEIDSPICGFNPPVCDLTLSTLNHTDETTTGAEDGTINVFYTTSSGPIVYDLLGGSGGAQSNYTGYFSNLEPGDYIINVHDNIGCRDTKNVTIAAFDSSLTRCKYRLRFSDVKTHTGYELRFLYQKAQFDPAIYPFDLTGTDSPIKRKTTISNEDKTEAFAPSSLAIEVIYDEVFTVEEFSDAQERDWKIELYKQFTGLFTPKAFSSTLTEETTPSFIDGNVEVKQDGFTKYRLVTSGTDTANLSVGSTYSIEAFVEAVPTGPNAKLRLTISRGSTVIYDKQIPAVVGNSLLKTGVVQNENYTISVTTLFTTTPVTTIDIPDIENPNLVLDWQGWLLPDQVQDFYADAKYAIGMVATDGLLSLKGSTFADQSLFYLTPDGIKRYVQLFGLKKWIYLVKICLDQLGYSYTDCTILSSLSYVDYKGSSLWFNISTWSDLFYDENNEPKSTYDALEILLKGVKLLIYQEKGKFVMVDNNDLYWRNILDLQPYCFLTDLNTFVNNSATLPSIQLIGANQTNKPTNPMQTLNKDNAFNRIASKVDFNLLSLLYPNPSFELNAVQGDLPDGMTQDAGMNAYADYQPQDPLNPNVGAYSGDWVMRTIGQSHFRGGVPGPVTQANGSIFFQLDGYKWVHPLDDFEIDQPNKKLNVSFVWRPVKYSDDNNWTPRLYIYYNDYISGNMWIYSLSEKGGYNGTGWYQPDHEWAFVFPAGRVDDYIQWNNVSITTDKFPESGIGHVAVGIGTPMNTDGFISPMTTDGTIDYDAFVITQSDSADQYNFQKGETHTVTNITTYAKSEKKDVALSLYTYPNNKRVSGNVSYGDSYIGSLMTNDWYFGLSIEQIGDRLPANIVRRFAKNYQRPMYKWQGDIITAVANYYSIWVLRGYTTRVFIPFTIDHDLRNSIANIVLIEVDDTQMQSIYQYLAIYEKSARNNLS